MRLTSRESSMENSTTASSFVLLFSSNWSSCKWKASHTYQNNSYKLTRSELAGTGQHRRSKWQCTQHNSHHSCICLFFYGNGGSVNRSVSQRVGNTADETQPSYSAQTRVETVKRQSASTAGREANIKTLLCLRYRQRLRGEYYLQNM